MDARKIVIALAIVAFSNSPTFSQSAGLKSKNFIVYSANPQQAREALETAEQFRLELANLWLGQPLPDWTVPCPIQVRMSPNLGAGGRTTYTMDRGTITHWDMEVFGSRERVLDSVLPHEITHTILATHFAPLGKPVPRWADEGACTTVEHVSERSKHDQFLIQFMSTGRAIPFAHMFNLRDYPRDIMPLYAQGYSVASFMIAQEGHQTFVQFLEDGMRTGDWVSSTERHYGYPLVGKLQVAWNQWVADGGGSVDRYTASALGLSTRQIASSDLLRNQTSGPSSEVQLASGFTDRQSTNDSNSIEPSGSFYQQQLEQNVGRSSPTRLADLPTRTPGGSHPAQTSFSPPRYSVPTVPPSSSGTLKLIR